VEARRVQQQLADIWVNNRGPTAILIRVHGEAHGLARIHTDSAADNGRWLGGESGDAVDGGGQDDGAEQLRQ
jgi:hypothetical protein